MNTEQKPVPEPQEGGRYIREEDGSLTLVHQTKPFEGRRSDAEQTAPAAAEAPDAGTSQLPE